MKLLNYETNWNRKEISNQVAASLHMDIFIQSHISIKWQKV